MSSDALRFVDITKRFGATTALDRFTARFPKGSLCAMVGPNGAGKTTAFSLVGGFLHADDGALDVLGYDKVDPFALKGRVGILPQDADLGDRHTPVELLRHLGRLQGMGRGESRREANRVLELVLLGDRRAKRIGTLSHGMRRRVAVASALLGDPELVLLDEPTAGLDPVQASSLRTVLERRRPGQTVVISSHNLQELERICDWVVMLDQGRCVREGAMAEVTGRGQVVEWAVGPGEVPVAALLGALPDEHRFEVEDGLVRHHAPDGTDLDAVSLVVAGALVAAGVPIREVRRGVGLEERFLADQAQR